MVGCRKSAVAKRICASLLIGVCFSSIAFAQAIYHVPPDAAPTNIGLGDVLNLGDGGMVADNFIALAGSTLNMDGGSIGRNFSATGAVVTVNDGVVGSYFIAENGTSVTLNGGIIGDNGNSLADFEIRGGASATFNGGTVTDEIRVQANAALTINSGLLLDRLYSASGSQVTVNGGTLSQFFNMSGNAIANFFGGTFNTLNTSSNAKITLHGTDFRFNGVLIGGLNAAGDSTSFGLPDVGVLSGTFADGTPFAMHEPDAVYLASLLTLKQTAPLLPGPSLIQVPAGPAPLGIHDGQTMIVDAGGTVGQRFNAGRGSTLVVNGGAVGDYLEAVGADVTVHGGTVGINLTALIDSTVQVNGGWVGTIEAYNGSATTIDGGIVSGVTANSGAVVALNGAAIGNYRGVTGSQTTLHGSDFRVNGVPVAGPTQVGETMAFNVPTSGVLSAILADGTPVVFARLPGSFDPFAAGTLTLKLAEAPPPVQSLIEAPADPVPQGLRPGQTLVLDSGATVPHFFTALEQSAVVMHGGAIGNYFRAVDSTVSIEGGSVGSNFHAFHGSEITIDDGSIGPGFRARNGSTVTIQAGEFGTGFSVEPGATATIHGGTFDFGSSLGGNVTINGGQFESAFVGNGSTVEINGGNHYLSISSGANVDIRGGAYGHFFRANSGSHLTLSGADFQVNGVPVAGLDAVGNAVQVNVTSTQLLSGTLTDGTPFAFMGADDDSLAVGAVTLKAANTSAPGPALIQLPSDVAPLGIRSGQKLVLRSGGTLPLNFNAGAGSEVQIHGGTVETNFEAVGANVLITGGDVAAEFDAFRGTTVDVFGNNFLLNGQPIAGLVDAGDSVVVTQRNRALLTGTLLGGQPVSFRLCASTDNCFTDGAIGDDFFDANATLRLTLLVAGDYDVDGNVDSDDYSLWRSSFASTSNLDADGNFDGVVDAADYTIWRNNLGSVLGGGTAQNAENVPEPASSAQLLAFVLLALAAVHTLRP